jgi:hypothetical protein
LEANLKFQEVVSVPIFLTESKKSIDVAKSKIKKIQVTKPANLIMDRHNLVFYFDEAKSKLYLITNDEAQEGKFGTPVIIPIWAEAEA